jgi:hypothetical protein
MGVYDDSLPLCPTEVEARGPRMVLTTRNRFPPFWGSGVPGSEDIRAVKVQFDIVTDLPEETLRLCVLGYLDLMREEIIKDEAWADAIDAEKLTAKVRVN